MRKVPGGEAYRQYDPASARWRSHAWRDTRTLAARWLAALAAERLASGDRDEPLVQGLNLMLGYWNALPPGDLELTLEPWTIENGLVTPTMKLKRPELEQRFAAEIARLYAGHDAPA